MRTLLLSLCLTLNLLFGQGVITTVAGTDFVFPSGVLPAISAPLGPTGGVAIDKSGNVYFSDQGNQRVMKVDSSGMLTVIAGNGFDSFSGDGGPATSASIGSPLAPAVDSAGNVFVVDLDNDRVRKISPNGTITVVAGNGVLGFSGDGGPAILASLSAPSAVAVDPAGNLFIADTFNNRIRKVTSDGFINTVAGNGGSDSSGDGGPATKAALSFPLGVAVDSAGNLFIADSFSNRIRKVTGDGNINTVAGSGSPGKYGDGGGDGGLATSASIPFPLAVTIDVAGDLFIADGNNTIRKVTPDGIIHTIAGNGIPGFTGDGGQATSAAMSLENGTGLAVDGAGNLFISDSGNNRIRKVTLQGIISTFAGNGAFDFSGDGGPAASACLQLPIGVTVDPAGNLFLADFANRRIRKITPDGVINTVAGNGSFGYEAGDGGLATNAPLGLGLGGVAVDNMGNLFVVDGNVIRKITPDGIISTVVNQGGGVVSDGDGGPAIFATLSLIVGGVSLDAAGNLFIADGPKIRKVTSDGFINTIAGTGASGFSGDGGPAINASFYGATAIGPSGLTVDAAGNLFIADSGNNRIRKITPDGIITTVAGNGSSDFSGDGGLAVDAALKYPTSVAVDSAGNLFIADRFNNRIREVTPDGIIQTVAGSSRKGFSGDGGLATGAALNIPSGIALDSGGNLFIADGTNRIRVVLSSPPSIAASPQTISIAGQTDGAVPPSSALTVSASVPNLPFDVSASTSDNADWLSVDVNSAATPRVLQITANPFSLSPGSYGGSITVQTNVGAPGTTTIPVSFTVTAGVPPALAVDRNSLSFTFPKGASSRTDTIRVMNIGGGSLDFSATVLANSGGSWLSVSPLSATATPSAEIPVSVTANPTGLTAGTYTGQIVIAGTSIPYRATIPVTMSISTNPSALLLSQTGLSFIAIEQGGIVPPQDFGVLNLGSLPLNISASASTLAGDNWLTATSSLTTATPLVDVHVDPSRLSAGRYYGLVSVRSPGAANNPQVLTSLLDVLPRGTDLGAVLRPTELAFSAISGFSSPGSQNVLIYNLTATPKSFRSSISDSSLQVAPQNATVMPTEPVTMVVQPRTDSLAPGTYHSTITLQFDDGRVRTIGVTVVVAPAAGASSNTSRLTTAAPCQATQLLPLLTSLGNDFNIPVAWPVALSAQVQDDCGVPLQSGSVIAEFSNGDPPLSLMPLKDGRWDATWQTARSQASVTITVKAATMDGQITGSKQVSGGFGADQQPPVVSESGVGDAASGTAFRPLSPGTLMNISGDRLSDQNAMAPSVPLGTSLANTSVLMAGQLLPLAATAPSQITAIIPYGLDVNTRQQLLVIRGATYSQPVSVNLAPSSPAIFVKGGTQGMILDTTGNVVGPGNAAKAGDLVTIYCTGLGALQSNVNAGDYGPPSSSTSIPVAVSIGGKNATVGYSGLAPGLVGFYFVRTVIPAGADSGDQVPVTITSLTTPPSTSQPVTIAIQP